MDKDRPRIAISFSGGRTSAVMTKLLIEKYSATHELLVTFANTGQEHPATLDFVKQCDERLGFNTVWLEAVVDPEKGKGVRHKVVSYHTASRDGRPFRDYIAKYGIPNMGSPKCTGVLKEDVMKHYLSSVWGRGTYATAIGIRADEESRVSVRAVEARFIYPLVDLGYTKQQVVEEVRTWGFDLTIPEHYGNCTWCWKKSYRKLLTIAKERPEFFDFPRRMEEEFQYFKCNPPVTSPDGRRLFFRKYKSVDDIFEDAKKPFEPFTDRHHIEYDENLDFGVGCGESCEIGSDERYGVDVANEEEDFDEKEFWG